MTKTQILVSIFGDCDYLHLVNGWFFHHNNIPMYISDYQLSNILSNSKNRKSDILKIAKKL